MIRNYSRKLRLYLNTVRHLKLIQVIYRIIWPLLDGYNLFNRKEIYVASDLDWIDYLVSSTTYCKDRNTFIFLNLKQSFPLEIDWTYNSNGKLWNYNLHYFDYLNQKDLNEKEGIQLIYSFIRNYYNLNIDLEPYPTSLRIINWVKFLSRNGVLENEEINKVLISQCNTLNNKIEYHILGNHILENAFALLFASYYFKNEKFYNKSKDLIEKELKRQILKDGSHFELSPMYHKLILFRVLDSINLISTNNWKTDALLEQISDVARLMLGWLKSIQFRDGSLPMVNDCTSEVAPETRELYLYASKLGINTLEINLSESGYRKLVNNSFEVFIDVGAIKANYQPGHTHSDIFSYVLYYKDEPIIVDTGTSTYENNARRHYERSTYAHNTISINNYNPIEVWSSFRVGNRADINVEFENNELISASHNGYRKFKITHHREYLLKDETFQISDKLTGKTTKLATSSLHFHPNVKDIRVVQNTICIKSINLIIEIVGDIQNIRLEKYEFANGFNLTEEAKCLRIDFMNQIQTIIR